MEASFFLCLYIAELILRFFLYNRNANGKLGFAGLRFYFYFTVMTFYNPVYDIKPDTCSFSYFFCSEERIKNTRYDFFWNSRSVINNGNRYIFIIAGCFNGSSPFFPSAKMALSIKFVHTWLSSPT